MNQSSAIVSSELVEMDKLLSKSFQPDAPGAAVIVIKEGQILLRKGYGMANLEWNLPVGPDTVFRIGSVTKQFTAVSILMLMEQGKLDLQDPIEKFLPDYPTQGHIITIEHLLTHTSGIKSYTSMDEWKPVWGKDFQLDELIDFFKFQPMEFAPGKKYNYNNSAYVLLGAIIEKASGQVYGQFIEQNIFKPLGMTQTYLELPGKIIPKRAAGYTKVPEGVCNSDYISMTQPLGAGGIVSTVDDLAKWDAVLYESRLISAENLRRAQTSYRLSDGSATDYGFGWGINTYQGFEINGHGGGIHGFICYMARVPQARAFAAILTNSDSPAGDPEELVFRIVAQVLGSPYTIPPVIKMTQRKLNALAGVYQIENGPEVNIFAEKEALLWNIAGSPDRDRIDPVSEVAFVNPDTICKTVHFIQSEDGGEMGMEVKNQYGKTIIHAKRTEKALPAES